ncbi:hypothetical protein N0V94_003675 [Neodidymelliopsis sp. IMI 364377]|nr:hypothetical protein N0V94_003675 [Neodidymelliopsis sp. IMI 364377]
MTQPQDQKKKIADITSSNMNQSEKIDEIAKIRGWFRPSETSAYYPIVQKYVDDAMDMDSATSSLFSPIDAKISAQQLDDVNFLDLWYSIIHAAKRMPFHAAEDGNTRDHRFHADIVDLVAAFRDHNITGNEQYNYLYSSLTDFSLACREAYNDAPDASASGLEIDAWANVNFFFAKVTEQGLSDLSIYAIWSLRTALEEEHEDDAEGTAVQKLDAFVPAAASWIFGMSRALYLKDVDLTPSDRKQGNPARGGPLWKGKAGFSKERWALWKERLTVVSKMEEISERTKNISRDAIEAMERAECFSDVRHATSAEL